MNDAAKLDAIRAMHHPKHGVHVRTLYNEDLDDPRIVEEPYVICDYDKTPWPCRTQLILEHEPHHSRSTEET